MDVREALGIRRAYRSLDPVEITDELIKDLAESASLAPSCFNYQPWRFVFVRDPTVLGELHAALSKTNAWVRDASMIIAVFSREEDDCKVRGRIYNSFDTGMATAFLILRATELGLVAHPIAGYREKRVKGALGIPEDMQVITLVNVGRHSETLKDSLTDSQKETEPERPERYAFEKFAFIDRYSE
ncbi:MAG: nitroreductase family protein [Candidatus Bathyarchaeota archaeon]|nr:nitroreductase family protein [Candidatus Bathyarchaeota archaeon]